MRLRHSAARGRHYRSIHFPTLEIPFTFFAFSQTPESVSLGIFSSFSPNAGRRQNMLLTSSQRNGMRPDSLIFSKTPEIAYIFRYFKELQEITSRHLEYRITFYGHFRKYLVFAKMVSTLLGVETARKNVRGRLWFDLKC